MKKIESNKYRVSTFDPSVPADIIAEVLNEEKWELADECVRAGWTHYILEVFEPGILRGKREFRLIATKLEREQKKQ